MAVPVLHGLGEPELDRLAMRILITRYLPGDTIVRQGDRGDRFYVVVDGQVEVIREQPGAQHGDAQGPHALASPFKGPSRRLR